MHKLNLKYNALKSMQSLIGCDEAIRTLTLQSNKEPPAVKQLYKEAIELLDIEFETQMKDTYKYLKELYDG